MSQGERALEALRRLLAEGSAGGQAKVDALIALAQRTVYVATWTASDGDFRTLVSSQGQNALPVFTDRTLLDEAAARLGWTGPTGEVPHREVGAREVFRHLFAHEIGFLIVDLGSPHSLESERQELEPLMSARARADSSIGPFAAVGRVSETMLQAVRPSRTSSSSGAIPAPVVSAAAIPAARASSPGAASSPGTTTSPGGVAAAASPGSTGFSGKPGDARVAPLNSEPSDELFEALSGVLRGYPEVEWAALCLIARGPVEPVPTVGLRVDVSYRGRVAEVIKAISEAAGAAGASLDVMLLDEPSVVRAVRATGGVFFPWRRRT